jgi:CRISPR-associated protein Cas2
VLAEKPPLAPEKPYPPTGWWIQAFADPPTYSEWRGHKCGEHEMLAVVAYDISSPKRLVRMAKLCEDHGMRVQYSIFECRLEPDEFEYFWEQMKELIDDDEDRIMAYRVCANCAQSISTAGLQVRSEQVVAYVM